MNFIKRNLKSIITFIIGAILATGVTVFATINANSVDYINNKRVSDALNELYDEIPSNTYATYDGTFSSTGTYTVNNLNFRPSNVYIIWQELNNQNQPTGQRSVVTYNSGGCYTFWNLTDGKGSTDWSDHFSTFDGGFSVDVNGNNGWHIYWVAIK